MTSMGVKEHRNEKMRLPCWGAALLVNLAVAVAAVLPLLLRNHGYMAMSHDFSAQEIPFNIFMNDTVKSGNLLWNWGIDLGGNFLEAFSFYNVGSVFFWITLLFPAKYASRIMGWMIIFKYAVAGATSAAYLSRHVKSRTAVIFGSLLYTFSGYACGSVVFYHFQDEMALFPLLLIGLELLVEEKKRGRLLFACVINLLCNYVFFVGEVIFLVMYYVIKYLIPEIREAWPKISGTHMVTKGTDSLGGAGEGYRNTRGPVAVGDTNKIFGEIWKIAAPVLDCILEGGIGAAITGILLVPSVRGTISNSRVGSHLPGNEWFSMSTSDWLLMLKAVLVPAEPMNFLSSITGANWMGNMAYLPLVGLTFVLAYVIRHKKDWVSGLLKLCLLVAAVPILNGVFMMFNRESYRRWYFMVILVMALASAKVMEKLEDYRFGKAGGLLLTLYGFYWYMLNLVKWDGEGNSIVFHQRLYYFGMAVGVGGVLLVLAVLKWGKRWREVLICVMTAGCSTLVLLAVTFGYQVTTDNTGIDFKTFGNTYGENVYHYLTDVPGMLERDILPYRYYFEENIGYTYYNLAMANSLPSINSFISTVNSSVTEFYEEIGVGRATWTGGDNSGTRELLSAKYIVSVVEKTEPEYVFLTELYNSIGQTFYLYENVNALPLGFTYDSYITRSEFQMLDRELRSTAMLGMLVVKDEDEEKLRGVLSHFPMERLALLTQEERPIYLEERREECTDSFEQGENSFRAKITADNEKYAFFGVPYDECWKAYVNGIEQEVLNINGLMAVRISGGENDIYFEYRYTPLKYGLILSLGGVLLCVGYLLGARKKAAKGN